MPDLGGPQLSRDDIITVMRRQQANTDLSDEELGIFADAQLRTKGSAARVAMASYASTAQLVLARSKVLQTKTTLPMQLTSVEKALVRAAFPERDFVFTDMERHDHGLAAAMRKIDRAILRERLPLRGTVVDIGGDYVYNLITEENVVHSCCPSVDAKDRFRAIERGVRLKQLARSSETSASVKTRVNAFLSDPTTAAEWTCNKPAEECHYPAAHLVMTHVYDMTLEQMAAAVLSHGAKTLSGCVILSADMLERPSGSLPSVNGWYSLDPTTQVMTYGTNNGSSWHYKHNWVELKRFAHDCVVISNHQPMAYRVTEVRGQTLYFEMWPMRETSDILANQSRRAYTVSGGPWALVKGYQFVAERGGEAHRRPKMCSLRYPWETWSRAMEYARGQIANGRFTLEDYARKMRTMTARLTINSVAVAGVEAVNEDLFADFLANSALAALYEVEKEKIEVQAALSDIHARREVVGPWGRALRGFSALLAQPWVESTGWLVKLQQRLKIAVLDRVRTVTFEYDDGSRVVQVAQFPGGSISVSREVPGLDGDLQSDQDVEVLDYMTSACMRDPELAKRMREVLDSTISSPPTAPDSSYSELVLDLAKVVSQVEDVCVDSGPSVTVPGDIDVNVDTVVDVKDKAKEPNEYTFDMEPIAGQDQKKARAIATELGVHDLLPSDEVGSFALDHAEVNAYYKDAMVEAIRLYHAEERRATSECVEVFGKTTVGGRPNKHLLNLLQGDGLKPDFYDIVEGRIVADSYLGVPSSLFSHSAIFLPPKSAIYRVDRHDEGLGVSVVGMSDYTGLGLVITDLTIYNGPEIRDAIATAIERFDIRNFTVVIRDGVPGCGKTTQILRGARYDDLILASGRENTIATRKKKIELDREMVEQAAKSGARFTPFQNPAKRIRTYDSYLMSRIFERADVVHADECFMQHSGKLMAAAVMSGARRIEFHGDTKQVPYVPRHTEDRCLRARLIFRHIHVNRYISHRCPQDAVAAIAHQYGYKIRTTSPVIRSLKLSTDIPLDAVQWDTSKKFLTIYQDDKATAAKKCYRGGVNTVAESQGETYDHVVFVRQQARKQDLYDSWPYVLVGLSRHTKTMEYTAPSATNSLFERQIMSCMANEEYCRQFGDVETAGKPTVVQL